MFFINNIIYYNFRNFNVISNAHIENVTLMTRPLCHAILPSIVCST